MLSGDLLILLIISYLRHERRAPLLGPATRQALRNWATLITWLILVPVVAASTGVPMPQAKPALDVVALATVPPPSVATGMPVPRWVTIKAGRVNVRRGPSLEDNVLWTYVRPGLPVEIIAEYDSWRRIRDVEGQTGWVKSVMLDGRRRVLFTGRVNTAILREPKGEADAVALAAPGLIADLVACDGEWCEVSARGYDGFVTRDRLWGVRANDNGR
jgi:SH3-like domain-containing protein